MLCFCCSCVNRAVWELGKWKQVASEVLLSWALKKNTTSGEVRAQLRGPSQLQSSADLCERVDSGPRDKGQALGFEFLEWAAGCGLCLTFTRPAQVGASWLLFVLYSHIPDRENTTQCKQIESLTFFIIHCLLQTLVLQAVPWLPKSRQASNNQQQHNSAQLHRTQACFDVLKFHLCAFFQSFSAMKNLHTP